eukprot:TRINITY_DN7320_c0_g1_i1.p1 TRINITY_DN7320_c0_g1~~TRINITY_DN7320_c0_g1_i1.p1  ORF type:complete len:291 (-),score=39.77 TRINITY_DN7320_c0_g1_i1:31-903(-)
MLSLIISKTNTVSLCKTIKSTPITKRTFITRFNRSHKYKEEKSKKQNSSENYMDLLSIHSRSEKENYYHHKYHRRFYSRFDRRNLSKEEIFLFSLLGLQAFVFILTLGYNDGKSRRVLLDHGTASLRNVVQGRVWTLVTSMFVHTDMFSLIFSSFVTYFIGMRLVNGMGVKRFAMFYILSGLVANSVYVAWNYMLVRNGYRRSVNVNEHGSKGAIGSIMAFTVFLRPTEVWRLYGLIPVPSAAILGVYILSTLYRNNQDMYSNGPQISLLGGVLFGLSAAIYLFRTGRIR